MSCCFLISIVQKLLRRNSSITDSVCFCNVRTLGSPHRAVPKPWNRIWQKSVLHRKAPQRESLCFFLFLHSFLAAESRIHEQGETKQTRMDESHVSRMNPRGFLWDPLLWSDLRGGGGCRWWTVTFLELSFVTSEFFTMWSLYRVSEWGF